MRYKVRTKTAEAYDRVLQELEDQQVAVVTKVPRRRMVAIEDLPRHVRVRISRLGAEIVDDRQYDVEQHA